MHTNQPTYQQLKELLADSDSVLTRLGLPNATFMIPTDGKGMRILVSGPKQQCTPGSRVLDWKLSDGETVSVLFEICDDFTPVEPLSRTEEDVE
ncbi:hypothetical protein [uncultured Gimesia sp.]|uniref:hypothetical protein n=1 Tax=uncultured Gimesia sp. TaxID=1678688 RepID=UPI0030DB9F54|tara:strand:+ start:21966 stop:22247 length:282 start_codon:yes stop_codon:yes gene_type:complete